MDLDQEPKRTDSDTGYRKGLLIVTTMQMNLSRRLIIGSLAVCVTSSAGAQTNLGQNKTGAQLYASVCADCHKSPQSLKPAGIFGLESFLREHYTADRQSAAAIAAYLNGLKKPLAESPRGRTAKRTNQAKPAEPGKSTGNEPRPPANIPRPPADLKLQKFD
ncbi:MAG: hypothetical protein ACM3Z4_07480 [Hyphomicrobiales bacterium]